MDDNSFDYMVKLLIIGDSGVGKTCILLRFTKDKFTESHLTTIGIDFMSQIIEVDGVRIKLQIWDTAGASGIILTYACDDKESLNNISNWMKSIEDHAGANISKLLIGNKMDIDDRCIKKEDGQAIAEKYQIPFFETSAKENINIDEAFEAMAKDIKEKIEQDKIRPKRGGETQGGVNLNDRQTNPDQKKKKCCK